MNSPWLVRGLDYVGTITGIASTTITGAVDNGSGLIRVTSTAHLLTTGDYAILASVGGTTEANGSWVVTVIDANTFDLVGSTFTNTYTSGGTVTKYALDMHNWSHLPDALDCSTTGGNIYLSLPEVSINVGYIFSARKTLAANTLFATGVLIGSAASISVTADDDNITVLARANGVYTALN